MPAYKHTRNQVRGVDVGQGAVVALRVGCLAIVLNEWQMM